MQRESSLTVMGVPVVVSEGIPPGQVLIGEGPYFENAEFTDKGLTILFCFKPLARITNLSLK